MQEGNQSRSLIHNTSLRVFILEFHIGTTTQKPDVRNWNGKKVKEEVEEKRKRRRRRGRRTLISCIIYVFI